MPNSMTASEKKSDPLHKTEVSKKLLDPHYPLPIEAEVIEGK